MHHLLALRDPRKTVVSVKQTGHVVALGVASAVLKHLPALDSAARGAIAPRVQTQGAVAAVKVASERVALFVAHPVTGFRTATVQLALAPLALQKQVCVE